MRKPNTVDECLNLLEQIEYVSFGINSVTLYYNKRLGYWSVYLTNPMHFKNPDIKADNPLDACHKMLDFAYEHKTIKI